MNGIESAGSVHADGHGVPFFSGQPDVFKPAALAGPAFAVFASCGIGFSGFELKNSFTRQFETRAGVLHACGAIEYVAF